MKCVLQNNINRNIMEDNSRVPAMDALLFAVVLEVALLQMKILDTSAARCSSDSRARMSRVRDKLGRDRRNIIDLMKRNLIELAENGKWGLIKHAVDTLKNNGVLLQVLKGKNEALKSSVRSINADLERQLHNYACEIENSNRHISHLRDRLKDSAYNTTIQLKYADKYLNARTESLQIELATPPISVPKADHEICVHNELLRAYELQIKEKEELLDYWQTRYVRDIATINENLKHQSEKYRITAIRRKEMEDLYSLHQGEMRGWLNFKKERAARLAREERANKAAVQIQAWWRGVMVRRCFGVYRYLRNSKKGTPKLRKK